MTIDLLRFRCLQGKEIKISGHFFCVKKFNKELKKKGEKMQHTNQQGFNQTFY